MKTIQWISLLLFVSLCQNSFSQNRIVEITTKRNDDNSVSFYYNKSEPGSYYVDLWFTNITNSNYHRHKAVVSGANGTLLKLVPSNGKKGISFSYKYRFLRGEANPTFDAEYVYQIPIGKGKESKISNLTNANESYFGGTKPKNWSAYCFYIEPGDTVFSARKGKVVEVVDKYEYITNFEVSYQSKANTVLVEHRDGTFAEYEGFKKNNIWVKPGQTVYPGTALGTIATYDNRKKGQLRFLVYYLDNTTFSDKSTKTIKDQIQHYSFVKPNFHTSEGNINIKHGETYTSLWNTELISKEFTRREKKKFNKGELKL